MKRKSFLAVFLLIFLFGIQSKTIAIGLKVEAPGFTECTVNADLLNIRGGPGTTFPIIKVVKKNTVLKVIGKINGWYIVQTSDNYLGMVSGWYITPNNVGTVQNNTNQTNQINQNNQVSFTITSEEEQAVKMVNDARKSAGLRELKIDEKLMKTARDKAKDMVDNNYFSHNSPTYGTPFEMMKNYGVTYKTAGENIAANSTISKAFEALMNSPGHKANILSSNFNYIGIGVVDSNKYGKVLVQMFIGK